MTWTWFIPKSEHRQSVGRIMYISIMSENYRTKLQGKNANLFLQLTFCFFKDTLFTNVNWIVKKNQNILVGNFFLWIFWLNWLVHDSALWISCQVFLTLLSISSSPALHFGFSLYSRIDWSKCERFFPLRHVWFLGCDTPLSSFT